jgi:hypothetical protein
MRNKPYPNNIDPLLKALVKLIPEIRKRHDVGFSEDDREDALMDSIVKVLDRERKLSNLKDLNNNNKPDFISNRAARQYALKMVRNRLIDMLRKEKRHVDSIKRIEEKKELFDNSLSERESLLLLDAKKLLSKLKEKDLLLIKAYFEGEPFFTNEIKSQMLKRGTARVKIHRLLKYLRELSQKNLHMQASSSKPPSLPRDPNNTRQ